MNVYIREVSRHLSDLGVEVDIFTRQQGEHVDTVVPLAEHARVIHVPAGPPRYVPKERVVEHLPEFICNMRDFILQNTNGRYQAIHSHYWLSGRVSGYFKHVWQVPMVAMFHTLAELKNQVSVDPDDQESPVRYGIERITVATADRVIAATPTDRSHLETYYEAERSRVTILPCGVDLDLFRPGPRAAARRRLGFGDERLLLFVGRVQRLKGIDLLFQAARLLADRHRAGELPAFKVVLVGGRPTGDRNDPEIRELRRLNRLAADLGIISYVHWVGAVDQHELPSYYRAADVTVVPSTYESFGLVALESMACRTPVVAARVGGLQTTVQDGATGFLLSERDPALYAERIAAIITAPETQSQLGRAARQRAMEFSWGRVAGQLRHLYGDLIAAHAAGEPPATIWQK